MSSIWVDLHDFSVVWMTAVIWLVQILIYPAFRSVPEEEFTDFHDHHRNRITFLVAPMLLQPLAVALVFESGIRGWEWIFQGASVVLIYAVTGFFSVPAHQRLSQGKDHRVLDRLIAVNWIRTAVWTAQLGVILIRRLKP